MASIDDILQDLTKLEKDSYVEIIDVALKQFSNRSVELQLLQNFYIGRKNREKAVYDAIQESYKNASIIDSYSMFLETLKSISGKNDDLDDRNGALNQSVYGEASRQRNKKRIIAELQKRGTVMSTRVIDQFTTYKDKLKDLRDKLT